MSLQVVSLISFIVALTCGIGVILAILLEYHSFCRYQMTKIKKNDDTETSLRHLQQMDSVGEGGPLLKRIDPLEARKEKLESGIIKEDMKHAADKVSLESEALKNQ